jgi:hypothetical protein
VRTVVILGMHRSGTSAVTRALNLLGGELGDAEHIGRYWENRRLREPLDAVLAAFGGAWDCPGAMPEGWETTPEARAIVPEARAALASLRDPEVLVWKDPRVCLEVPFWRPLLADPVAVLIHRHPEEVSASLDTRNGFGPGLSFALWERYNHDALLGAAGLPTVVISYGELVERPAETMRSLVDTLAGWGIHFPRDPGNTDLELRARERHHVATAAVDHPSATRSQRELAAALTALEGVHDALTPPPLPDPDPSSIELIDLRRQVRAARRELWQARTAHRRLAGSRRRLLAALLHPGRVEGLPPVGGSE